MIFPLRPLLLVLLLAQLCPAEDLSGLKESMVIGYTESLLSAVDAAKEGPAAVPMLAQLLAKRPDVANPASVYPYNVIWALAQT